MAGLEAQRSMRWLAWAVGCLVLAGVVTAGVRVADGDRPSRAVVTAGDQSGTVDVTSTVTIPLPIPSSTTPPSTVATTTTLPKAAVDVLNAIAGSTTTTRRPATTTTRPPAPPTTASTPTTAAPATTSTTTPRFSATLVNNHPDAVLLSVNGQPFPLAPGQTLDVELPLSARGDVIQARLAGETSCGVTDSGEIFRAGGRYRMAILLGESLCEGSDRTRPRLDIGPI